MPKATVHKDHGSLCTKDQVRRAGQVGDVEPVAKSALMQEAANSKLGLRILAPNCRHVQAALVRADRIQCSNLRCDRSEIIVRTALALNRYIEAVTAQTLVAGSGTSRTYGVIC